MSSLSITLGLASVIVTATLQVVVTFISCLGSQWISCLSTAVPISWGLEYVVVNGHQLKLTELVPFAASGDPTFQVVYDYSNWTLGLLWFAALLGLFATAVCICASGHPEPQQFFNVGAILLGVDAFVVATAWLLYVLGARSQIANLDLDIFFQVQRLWSWSGIRFSDINCHRQHAMFGSIGTAVSIPAIALCALLIGKLLDFTVPTSGQWDARTPVMHGLQMQQMRASVQHQQQQQPGYYPSGPSPYPQFSGYPPPAASQQRYSSQPPPPQAYCGNPQRPPANWQAPSSVPPQANWQAPSTGQVVVTLRSSVAHSGY
eukprot:gnl/TRDRNA2_/TRDRNA2_159947_c0_seq1.p1 gnl/TRDRNA2_/TRDRNA2_159947_c0~~gnl/TRDRNA2_/TRDRNA2_159947_c0_seq1.p1  ORF type:complete len:318 (-),score=23.10 gnl/TRDRNA2_/TRDRNA2_159947_c0_seq1:103-1056(-)